MNAFTRSLAFVALVSSIPSGIMARIHKPPSNNDFPPSDRTLSSEAFAQRFASLNANRNAQTRSSGIDTNKAAPTTTTSATVKDLGLFRSNAEPTPTTRQYDDACQTQLDAFFSCTGLSWDGTNACGVCLYSYLSGVNDTLCNSETEVCAALDSCYECYGCESTALDYMYCADGYTCTLDCPIPGDGTDPPTNTSDVCLYETAALYDCFYGSVEEANACVDCVFATNMSTCEDVTDAVCTDIVFCPCNACSYDALIGVVDCILTGVCDPIMCYDF